MKQSKLRRKRVFRYSVLYFVMLVIFVALIAGPIAAGKYVPSSLTSSLKSTNLVQPTGEDNDDTKGSQMTGTGAANYTGVYTRTATMASTTSSSTSAAAKLLLY
jgi:1,3-beta-glucan synthase